MKKKAKLAEEWFGEDQSHDFKNAYVAGFEKMQELALAELQDRYDWVFEGWNSGDKTIEECNGEAMLLHNLIKHIKRIGEEEET